MKNRSYDREELVEPSEAPDPSGSGTFVEGDVELRTLLHDTRNWLAVALAHLELAVDAGEAGPRVERARQALLAARSRLDSPSTLRSPVTHCEARSLARECLQHLAARWGEGRRRLEETSESAELWVAMPPEALANLLLNLLENAAHATVAGGSIRVQGRRAGVLVHLTVEDDGVGMDPSTLRRCLTPGTSSRPGVGQGLGLPQAVRAVEEYGGSLRIESERGEGCQVHLELPVAEREPGTSPAPERSSGHRVLLVEDDPAVAEALGELLAALGASSRAVGSAGEAEAALADDASFDLVLVDQGLPDRPGLELAARLRASHSDLTIVLLTGDPRAASTAADSTQVDQVATKPLGLEALRALLSSAPLGDRRHRREDEARG